MPLVLLIEAPAYIFHYLTIKRLLPVKKSPFARLVLLFISFLLVGMIIYIGDWGNLPPTFFIYLIGIQYACKGSPAKKLTLSLMLTSTIFAFNTLLDNIFLDYQFYLSAVLRLLFSVFLYIIIRFWGPDTETELGNSLWHLMSFLTLAPLGIVLSIVLIPPQEWIPKSLLPLYTVLLLLALFSFMALLWAIAVLSKQQKLEQQNLYAEMNQNYYESLKRQHFEIRRLKHDLSNHLHTLSLLPEQEKDGYISQLLESPGFTQRTDYCGDMTVNAVLSIKDPIIQESGISLTLKLDIPEELPFEKSDICVMFANALDNAIESCLKFPKEQRFIELTARHQKGILALSIKNPTQNSETISSKIKEGKPSENFPSSTKSDKKHHGYGLRSIETIVQHYQGSLEINASDGVFELFLYLQEPQIK
ncbi:MAG: sensor histidine kinase [Lachnospiraceae bacterium]|nr:sensor histidine kinase [Lachnospiraceae bacterium]